MPTPGTIRARLLARPHAVLLAAIVSAFAVRPLIGDTGAAPIVFSFALVAVVLATLLTIQIDELVGDRAALLAERRRRMVVGWTLAVVALAERLLVTLFPSYDLILVSSICWAVFFGFATWSQLRNLLKQRAVTSETICSAVSVYLLLGLTWGLLYVIIFVRHQEAFSFATPPQGPQQVIPILTYFSMTTLATIGFGDITPVTLPARYMAVAEGITGQFYLAILVARLVGLQMSQNQLPTNKRTT